MSPAYTINPDDIRLQEFRTRMRGYDPAQVRSYLEEIADQVQHLHAQLRDLRSRLSDAQQQADTSVRNRSTSADVPGAVHQFTEEYSQAAETDAAGVVARARIEADAIVADARAQVERLTSEAAELTTLKQRIISQIETLLNSQLEHLRHLQRDLSDDDDRDAPEAPPVLARLDDTTQPG
jgi:cell division initiation protein